VGERVKFRMKSKVSLIRCNGYRSQDVYRAVKASVELLGGISSIVSAGQRVLIKPNLLSAKPPESGIDTHPEVVRAVIRFDKVKMIKGIPVAAAALEADVFISLPKFKTHCLVTLTGGVKNVFGIVPGLFKTECHKLAPNPVNFARLLVDIYSFARPHLSIVDGIVGMEGEGPGAAGTLRRINLIAGSTDAVSLDAVLARVMGLLPFDIPTTREADRRGLGIGRMGDIEVVGDDLSGFIQSDFKLPKTSIYRLVPNPLLRFPAKFLKVKPQVKLDKCTRCGLCVRSCPMEAISEKNGEIKFDHRKCILCLCCHEFCPENAIFFKENMLVRMIRT
jgi:uncharacterized protein (DUF362 family)/ferredoxin